jgi:N-acetylmuramoyl-L-alanine amidase
MPVDESTRFRCGRRWPSARRDVAPAAPHANTRRWTRAVAPLVLAGLLSVPPPAPAAASQPDSGRLQAGFVAAAREFGVPERLLLAVSYSLSRWEHHAGQPSTGAGYGLMHLSDPPSATVADGKGTGAEPPRGQPGEDPRQPGRGVDRPVLSPLAAAARLLDLDPEVLRRDPAQNVRGGAALLAQYARETVGALPVSESEWYGAVARFSGASEAMVSLDFADDVYATLAQGAARTTSTGQVVQLDARAVQPNRHTADALPLRHGRESRAECPPGLTCRFVPAAYTLNVPSDPADYGNYDLASRPADGLDIRYIVVHDTEIPYAQTIQAFQNPRAYVSAHYVIRSSDGQVTQMVPTRDVAWHAGNWYVNTHAIGIEHEGVAVEGATWYTERLYRASARLVRYLSERYGVPLDRAHILGHDDVPGPTPGVVAGMHWDPGPFWDWDHYLELVGRPIVPRGRPSDRLVTIRPRFQANQPAVTDCSSSPTRELPRQPASFVYLYTAPSFTAPLLDDPALPGPGTTCANDWGDKAATGQSFYRAERRGDWDAVYYGGQLAWMYNPHGAVTVPGRGTLVRPRAGRSVIPVYGRAYPEPAAFPPDVPVQEIVALPYTIPAGQIYVATDRVRSDYYHAVTFTLQPADHVLVRGSMAYYQIFFNHRLGFVRVEDLEEVEAP